MTIYDTTSIYFDSLSGHTIPLNEYHLNFTKDKVLMRVGRTLNPFDYYEFGQIPVDKLDTVKGDRFALQVKDAVKKLYKNTSNLYAIRLSITQVDTLEGVKPGEYYKVTSRDYYRAYYPKGDTFPEIYFRLDLKNGRIFNMKIQ